MSRAANSRQDAPGWERELEFIASAFQSHAARSFPLYAQLHKTMEELIRQGTFVAGQQMPPEQALASALGISLGTVQKGLQSLHSKGLINREHGRGTFVSSVRNSLTSLRFFRFCNPADNKLLAVYATILNRQLLARSSDQLPFPGKNKAGYIRITRLVDVDGRFTCHSQLFLPASVFGEVMTMPVADLENVNLKQVFFQKLGINLDVTSYTIRCCEPSEAVCRDLNIEQQAGMQMEIRERSQDGGIEIHQSIFVPTTEYPLSINLGTEP